MKKILAILLSLVFLMTTGFCETLSSFSMFPAPESDAQEENAPESEAPETDGDSGNDNSSKTPGSFPSRPSDPEAAAAPETMTLTILNETYVLDYDDDPYYSLTESGYVQASFYAYGDEDMLYELYLVFPVSVQSGDVITPQSSIRDGDYDTSILFYLSDESSELCAMATQYMGVAYPEGSGYSLEFDSVTEGTDGITYTGTFTATLMVLDPNYDPVYPIENVVASFSFTMDESAGTPYNPGFGGSAPSAPSAPSAQPNLVTPPDAQKI